MPKPIIKRLAQQGPAPSAPAVATQSGTSGKAPIRSKPLIKKKVAMQRICGRCGGEEFVQGAKCAFCNSRQHLRAPLPGEVIPPPRMLMALGPHAWGLGMLAEDAVKHMANNLHVVFRGTKVKYQLWDVPRSAYLANDGQIRYAPDDKAPKLIKEATL